MKSRRKLGGARATASRSASPIHSTFSIQSKLVRMSDNVSR
jgi:hypothetical protein